MSSSAGVVKYSLDQPGGSSGYQGLKVTHVWRTFQKDEVQDHPFPKTPTQALLKLSFESRKA